MFSAIPCIGMDTGYVASSRLPLRYNVSLGPGTLLTHKLNVNGNGPRTPVMALASCNAVGAIRPAV
jgi:hypothetical protein